MRDGYLRDSTPAVLNARGVVGLQLIVIAVDPADEDEVKQL